ncbi:MAG: hypothetical protein Marn2KO_36020 [Marinobacter nauticus]
MSAIQKNKTLICITATALFVHVGLRVYCSDTPLQEAIKAVIDFTEMIIPLGIERILNSR